MTDQSYTTNFGDFVILKIMRESTIYLAQVTENNQLKIMEDGPAKKLKTGDYIINERLTLLYQQNLRREIPDQEFIDTLGETKVYSGLTSVFGSDPKEILEVIFTPD